MSTLRSLLIAGAQKSCSTSLAELVGRHPLVNMSKRECVAFEDPYYPEHLDQVQVHVESSFAADMIPGVKRPELLHRSEASSRARRHLPDPVVVVVLREPVARTISAYYHYVGYGLLPAVGPSSGIAAILDELDGEDDASIGGEVVTYSLYSGGLRRLYGDFGERLVVFFQEDLVSDTAACTERIFRMLGIEAPDLGGLPRSNVGSYSLRPLKLSRLGGRVGYDIDDSCATFTVTQQVVRRRIAQALFGLDRLCPSIQRPQPMLSLSVRRRLVSTVIADVALLPDIIGRPLPGAWVSSLQL